MRYIHPNDLVASSATLLSECPDPDGIPLFDEKTNATGKFDSLAELMRATWISTLMISPAPFFWNPPAWITALINPATSRFATLAFAVTHPWMAPRIIKILTNKNTSSDERKVTQDRSQSIAVDEMSCVSSN